MIADNEKLIADYLAGRSSPEDVGRLEALIRVDEAFRRRLLEEAFMDVHLRQTLGGLTLGPTVSLGDRRRWLAWLSVAAMLALAVAGWAMAINWRQQAHDGQTRIASLQVRVAELQNEAVAAKEAHAAELAMRLETPATDTVSPQIIDTRGMVLLLPKEQGQRARSAFTGSAIPAGQAVWTCPWGGVGTRYADGTSVSLSRSTTVAFGEENGSHRIRLHSGTVSLERFPEAADEQPAVIETSQAIITMERGLVTVVAGKTETLVEVGTNQAVVMRKSDGVTITVRAGQYGVVGDSGELKAVRGRLQMNLQVSGDTPTGAGPQ